MASSPTARALEFVFWEHYCDNVISRTFGREVALNRAIRWVLDSAEARHELRHLPTDVFVVQSYWRPAPGATGVPQALGADVIAFNTEALDNIHGGDIIQSTSEDLETGRRSTNHWCILDVRVADATRIIPATIVIPYADSQPSRCDAELDNTDMLPLWFWQHDGSLGVPITAPSFDCLLDLSTRVVGTSLNIAFWWCNYPRLEKQIQTRGTSSQPSTSVTLRRLAGLTCGAVRNAMADYERTNAGRTEWQDSRYKIGTGLGYISIHDVILLGIVFVSPGRVMPLLQLGPDFAFEA
ncbi:hypothetical protein PENSPDRAFT_755218 [Peniophora sp. CONT]|nr:hypothetical protein PENSPDRAFT_755218 [Peniophora sp. CONT]